MPRWPSCTDFRAAAIPLRLRRHWGPVWTLFPYFLATATMRRPSLTWCETGFSTWLSRPVCTAHSSDENVLHHVTMDIGQPEVTPLETVGQALMVETEAAEDGGVEVVNVDRLFDDVVAEVVGRAMGDARLDASACHP